MSLPDPDHIPLDVSLILSSDGDEKVKERQIRNNSPMKAVRQAIPYLLGRMAFADLTIGVDPGPRPGIAVFGDDVLLEAFESTSVDAAVDSIREIKDSYIYRNLKINIGDGDRPNGDSIAGKVSILNLPLNFVDERNTSQPHKMHNNALSAARIAQGTGYPLLNKNDVKIRNRDALEFEFTTLRKALTR